MMNDILVAYLAFGSLSWVMVEHNLDNERTSHVLLAFALVVAFWPVFWAGFVRYIWKLKHAHKKPKAGHYTLGSNP